MDDICLFELELTAVLSLSANFAGLRSVAPCGSRKEEPQRARAVIDGTLLENQH